MTGKAESIVSRPRRSVDAADRRDAAVHVSLGSRTIKRAVDIALAAPLAALTLPIVLVLMLCSALALRAWPLFTQQRIGRYGKSFTMVKIRSLAPGVSASADKYELEHVEISRFGRVVRATHLDELPQLWLVLTGRMSLIGHRPEMPHLDALFSDEQRSARDGFRPGCSGLWQLSPDAGGLMVEHPVYDLWYAERQSLRLDVYLMALTVLTLLGHRKVELGHIPRICLSRRPLEALKA
jgi:lipopolysaccharide/colanic/teichoic acid biosynthesis glycosyltransferase